MLRNVASLYPCGFQPFCLGDKTLPVNCFWLASLAAPPHVEWNATVPSFEFKKVSMHKNNFDGVRIGLALIVVFSHLYVLTQRQEFLWLGKFFDARFAVEGFFAISGYLVTKSYFSSKSLFEYAEKRFRRIYPAYFTVIMLCLLIGAYTTSLSLPAFFSATETYKFLLANLSFLNFIQPTLPQALEGNLHNTLNGSLWTIKVEVMLYFCVPVIAFLFTRLGSIKVAVLAVLASVLWVYYFQFVVPDGKGIELAKQFPGHLSFFVLGSLFAVNKAVLAQVKWIALASTVLLFSIDHPYAKLLIDPVAYASIVVYLSTSAFRSINFGKYGDVSYGIYLYHFPIIQLLIFKGVFQYSLWLGLLLTVVLTLLAAWISWHLIEKGMLKRNSHYLVAAKH